MPAIQIPKSKVDVKRVSSEICTPDCALARPEPVENGIDIEVVQVEEPSEADLWVAKHKLWFDCIVAGDVEGMEDILKEGEYCLLETIQGNNIVGVGGISKLLERFSNTHKLRIRILEQPMIVEHQGSVITTSGIFGILQDEENENSFSSKTRETFWWNVDTNHIIIARERVH